jgi:hypothetical protein
MSIAPNAGIVALDNFKEPTVSVDGQQGQVPKPLAGQQNYVLTASGFVSGGSIPGLGTMASQNANNVAITGGAIDGTAIGGTTPAAGAFTTLSATTALALSSGGTGKTTAPAAQANLLGYTTYANNSLATTAASGNGTTATLTFAVQASAPYAVGSYISVIGITPTGYGSITTNYFQVTACTTTTVSYLNATTGSQTVAGTIAQVNILANTSSFYQYFTGTNRGAIALPDTSTLQLGWSFLIDNNATGTVVVYSSTGVSLTSVGIISGLSYYYTCVDTTVNTAAAWRIVFTGADDVTGSGNVVFSTSPSIAGITVTGTLALNGSTTSTSSFHTTQTTAAMTLGGTGATGLINIGRATTSQPIQIGSGITATSTTASGTASSITTTTLTVGGTVTGTFSIGMVLSGTNVLPSTYITALGTGTGGAGTYTINKTQTVASTTITGTTAKSIDIGINGASGSVTNITLGSATSGATSSTNINGTLNAGFNNANYVQVVGAAAGSSTGLAVSAQGSDGSVNLNLNPKGTGSIQFDSIKANYIQIKGAVTGAAPSIAIVGADADIQMSLVPKGLGIVLTNQQTPAAVTATGTLTIANLLTQIITSTSATAVSLTLPTGTLSDAGVSGGTSAVNTSFEYSIINLGSAVGDVTMVAGTAHTIVGSATVAVGTSGRFRCRKTATNTFVSYRV